MIDDFTILLGQSKGADRMVAVFFQGRTDAVSPHIVIRTTSGQR
jgi:hypothetical protein